MALTANVELLNTIPDVVLCGNRVPLQLQASTNLIETAGSKAEIWMEWTDEAVADEYFDLLLAGETVRFTCKAAPDNSGTQFHDNTLAASLTEWVALIAEDLQQNYLIARYYDVQVSNDFIGITAKVNGADYTQEFTAGAGIDVNITETDKTGVDEVLRSFYKIVVLLYCNDELVTELTLNVSAEGLAEVDVADLLKSYLVQDFEWPESDVSFIFDRTDAIAEWYFRYGEKWGDNEYNAFVKSDTYYVINGGISFMQLAKYNAETTSFWAKLVINKYFLSWAPMSRYITPTDPVKLFFLNHSGATEFNLMARLYSSDPIVNLVTGFYSNAYEVFVSSGIRITSAIETGTAGHVYTNGQFAIATGEVVNVSVNITQNSGQLPSAELYVTGYPTASNVVQLVAGENNIKLTSTRTGSTCRLRLFNTAAADYSTGDILLYRDPEIIAIAENEPVVDKGIYEMVLSPARINYNGLSDESLIKFDIWIEDESGVRVSEERTFILDYLYYEHTRYFIFRNSMGAYEVLRTTGLMARADNYSREIVQIRPDTDYTSRSREEISVNNLEQQKFSVAMGWLSRYANADEYRNWLRDFSLSKEVYQVIGNTLKPIRITNDNLDQGKDRDSLTGFVFEFVNAFTDEHFTKEITSNLVDESWADDFERAQ